MWTITHLEDGVRVKTFSQAPWVWQYKHEALWYLSCFVKAGDLRAKVLGDDKAASLRVEPYPLQEDLIP